MNNVGVYQWRTQKDWRRGRLGTLLWYVVTTLRDNPRKVAKVRELKKEWTNGKRTKGTFRVKCEKYKDFISPVPWNPSTRTKRFYKLLFILHKAKHWKKKGEIVQHIYLNIWLTIFVTLPSSSNDLWAKANFIAYKINQQTHL